MLVSMPYMHVSVHYDMHDLHFRRRVLRYLDWSSAVCGVRISACVTLRKLSVGLTSCFVATLSEAPNSACGLHVRKLRPKDV